MMEKKAEIEQQEKISELLKQMQEKDIDMKELMQIYEGADADTGKISPRRRI